MASPVNVVLVVAVQSVTHVSFADSRLPVYSLTWIVGATLRPHQS